MKEIKDIVKEYGEEFFTNDFLLSGDETWDLEALAWFDEKYPELSDEQRSEFSVQLDILFKECCTQALEQYRAGQEKIKNAPSPIVFEGLTLHELLEKTIQKFKEHDFTEAKRLLITYQEIKEKNNKHQNDMKKVLFLLFALMMSAAVKAQEIEKVDKFTSGYINGTYMNKFKTIDGVLYAVGYEGTKDWILVRYPAGSRNTTYTVHENCRRIARGAFEGASYLREIYLPTTVSFIGEDAFAGCTSLQGIYYGESTSSAAISLEANNDGDAEEVARYDLSGRPCLPSDKGVQVIVYSDFTTRTVIVE